MGCCRGATSKCVQCLVAHVLASFWAFQGVLDKKTWLTLYPGGRILVDDHLSVNKQMTIDLLTLTFLERAEFAMCYSRIWRWSRGSTRKSMIHHLGSRYWRILASSEGDSKLRQKPIRLAFCSIVRFFGDLAHYWSFLTPIDYLTSQESSLFSHWHPFLKVFPHESRPPLFRCPLESPYAIWARILDSECSP